MQLLVNISVTTLCYARLMLANIINILLKFNLLSVFVVEHHDTFVLSFLGSWLEFCLLCPMFMIFHVVHVNFTALDVRHLTLSGKKPVPLEQFR